MAGPINTTLPYALRNQLIPVFRSGNFAGPGYAGAMGLETVLQNNAVNGGKPILVSDLVKTPEGLIAFMKVAIQVQPNGYLDTVTRNHDVEYTVAELRYSHKVQTQFSGKLPHELNRDEQSSPACCSGAVPDRELHPHDRVAAARHLFWPSMNISEK